MPPHVAQKYKRLGKAPAETGKVYALDLKSGKAVWQQETTATALAYSELHDNLVESYSKGTLGKKESRPAIIRKGIDGSQRFTVKGAPLCFNFWILFCIVEGALFSCTNICLATNE